MGKRVELVWYKNNWYHPNFFKQGPLCIKRAKYTCQHCGKKANVEYVAQTGRADKVVIQAAHVNHDPWNGRAKLIALCKQCHMSYDHAEHVKTIRRNRIKTQIDNGQLVGNWYERAARKRKASPTTFYKL